MLQLSDWIAAQDPLWWLLVFVAVALIFSIFLEQFEDIELQPEWAAPPRFLTSHRRYKAWRFIYACLGVLLYAVILAVVEPIAEIHKIASLDIVRGPFAPLLVALIVAGIAFPVPWVSIVERRLRRATHRAALIPDRSNSIVADLKASPMLGEPQRGDSDPFDEAAATEMRGAVVERFEYLGVDDDDFEAPPASFSIKKLRALHLFWELENNWSVNKPYTDFFVSAEDQWLSVRRAFKSIEARLRFYENMSDEEKRETEEELEKFLNGIYSFISYIILYVQFEREKKYALALESLSLRPTFYKMPRITYTGVCMFGVFGLIFLVGAMLLLFLLANMAKLGEFPYRIAANVSFMYYAMILITLMCVVHFRNRGLRGNWWPIPETAETATAFQKFITLRDWRFYFLSTLIGIIVGIIVIILFSYVAVPPPFEIDDWSRTFRFTFISILPGVTALFLVHYIDGHLELRRSVFFGLLQGGVTAAILFVAAVFAFDPLTDGAATEAASEQARQMSIAEKWVAIGMTTIMGFLVGLLVGWPVFQVVREDLIETD